MCSLVFCFLSKCWLYNTCAVEITALVISCRSLDLNSCKPHLSCLFQISWWLSTLSNLSNLFSWIIQLRIRQKVVFLYRRFKVAWHILTSEIVLWSNLLYHLQNCPLFPTRPQKVNLTALFTPHHDFRSFVYLSIPLRRCFVFQKIPIQYVDPVIYQSNWLSTKIVRRLFQVRLFNLFWNSR